MGEPDAWSLLSPPHPGDGRVRQTESASPFGIGAPSACLAESVERRDVEVNRCGLVHEIDSTRSFAFTQTNVAGNCSIA